MNNSHESTGVHNYEAKAERVLAFLADHPGAGTISVGYAAKLAVSGPMGSDGRTEALGVLSVLEHRGEVDRDEVGGYYYWRLAKPSRLAEPSLFESFAAAIKADQDFDRVMRARAGLPY